MVQAVSTNELNIQAVDLRKAAHVMRAVNHKLRQEILMLLHNNKRMKVTDLYIKMRLEQSVASQHLAILRRAGFVLTKRDGKFVYYSVDYERLKTVQALAQKITMNKI